jgi:hypothetical protein
MIEELARAAVELSHQMPILVSDGKSASGTKRTIEGV